MSSQRSELVRELIHFDRISALRASYDDWRLPSSWKWDPEGGPKGQELRSFEDFPGLAYSRHNSDDFKTMIRNPRHLPERSSFLGEGCFGEVDRVRCNGKILARKRTDLFVKYPHMSKKEINAMKNISHIHISQLIGIYIVGDDLHILSYPVAEMTLYQYMKLYRCDDATWLHTLPGGMGCLSNALAYMHSAGVKHGDVHDRNVLLLGGCMILCDFGLADLNGTGALSPKNSFISNKRAWDVLNLGILFEQMLASVHGHTPKTYVRDDRPQTRLGRDNFHKFSEAPKPIDLTDFRCLFEAMTTPNEYDRPTAASVAKYFRRGYFELRYKTQSGFVNYNTCGDCCM